jgi:hypothetical protein
MKDGLCPRRPEGPFNLPEKDEWRADKTCSFCGSLDPAEALKLIEAGEELCPTDKSYKMYVGGGGGRKVYFQHFDREQRERLIELLNAKKIKFAYPGHFYVRPFFIAKALP